MKALQNNKGMIVAIVIFIIAIGAYNLFFKSSASEADTTASKVSVGKDVLELNANIQSVTLDRTLFGTTAYKSLVDFSSTLESQPVGRHNPFGTIGSDSGQASSQSGSNKN